MFKLLSHKDFIEVNSESSSLFCCLQDNVKKFDSQNIYLWPKRTTKFYWEEAKKIIAATGQFSFGGFEIESQLYNESFLCFKLKSTGATLAYVPSVKNVEDLLTKSLEANILILNLDQDTPDAVVNLTQNSNPRILVLAGNKSFVENVALKMSIDLTVIENGYKIKPKDISGESIQILTFEK